MDVVGKPSGAPVSLPRAGSQEPGHPARAVRDESSSFGSHPAPSLRGKLLALLPLHSGETPGSLVLEKETQLEPGEHKTFDLEGKIRFSTKMRLPKPRLQAKLSNCFDQCLVGNEHTVWEGGNELAAG